MTALALILCAANPSYETVDRVDVVELNRCYRWSSWGGIEKLEHSFDQLIWYEWDPEFSEHVIVAWKIYAPKMRPAYINGVWVVVFDDGLILRRVEALSFRETMTDYDPEMEARKWLPHEMRRGLSR